MKHHKQGTPRALPKTLREGMQIITATGHKAFLVATNEITEYRQEALWRCRHKKSGVLGEGRFTRKDLVSQDVQLLTWPKAAFRRAV